MSDRPVCDAVVILCTAPDESCAQQLARLLLEAQLAACVTLLPGAQSLYYWEGRLEQQTEVQMLIKSDISHQQALLAHLKHHHPYETPELLVLPVVGGDSDYLTWLNASLR
ncbi:divalent cation tolerance protein CutA [Brenneria roseae subsp. roseae]|uniref:divalent cation tolerance protein CutA n=1 Tax=Brenneria roseae TaxID=1509241 RepID=UPI000D60BE6E|nr:divalent cation tolerance protein CutA [Brenneria roseae]PWC15540.1 divalent cation tolerance protein CutA [Brenneria roseae subsp. roseae]